MPTRSAPLAADPLASEISQARSLADDIRARSDDQLRTLLRRRPDLARPAPADLTSLAARASTRASVQRSLDSLDQAHLHVLDAAVVAGGAVNATALAGVLGGDATAEAVAPVLDSLWALALVWRSPEGPRVVRTVDEVLGPHPAGLGPSVRELARNRTAVTTPMDADEIRATVSDAPEAARAVVNRLVWGPPVGVVPSGADAPAAGSPLAEALEWLAANHVVATTPEGQIILPREVALALRGGRLHRDTKLEPLEAEGIQRDAVDVDQAAGGQVSDLLVLVDELASAWGPHPPRVLRAGGLSVRDLRQLTSLLDVDESRAAFVAEVALAAGLIADDGSLEPVWAPTPAYDEWQQQPGATQWATLARAWLSSTRAAYLVGTSSPGTTGTVNALGPDAHWPPARALRRDILAELARLPAGLAPELVSVVGALRWRRPRRMPADLERVLTLTLAEAEWLGVTGRGALSDAGRALLDGLDDDALAATMHPHLPSPVEKVLLQADLTAVAPGPLVGSLAQFMRLVADVESRGGATVYRFSSESVRRCLDAGWSADQVLSGLADASQTPVPQPLDYVVRDVARRHGQTRVGSVSCYIRSDDRSGLEAMAAERALAPLQLRHIAPTVLVSPAAAEMVLEVLRDNGFAPVIETAGGGIVVPEVRQRRSAARRPTPTAVYAVDDEVTASLVSALRAGEESAAFQRAERAARPGPQLPSTDPTTTLAILREAAADRQGVWLGYSNAEGQVARLLFYPERVEGGRVHGNAEGIPRTLSVHRITGAAAE